MNNVCEDHLTIEQFFLQVFYWFSVYSEKTFGTKNDLDKYRVFNMQVVVPSTRSDWFIRKWRWLSPLHTISLDSEEANSSTYFWVETIL